MEKRKGAKSEHQAPTTAGVAAQGTTTPGHRDSEDPRATQTARLETLAAELEAHRQQLGHYERALVDRIADVDDDRRRNAAQLKRFWQSQREEIDGRLRRQGMVTMVALVLIATLAAGAVAPLYLGTELTRSSSADDIAEIKQELEQSPRLGAQDELIEAQLAQLTSTVDAITAALSRLTGEQERLTEAGLISEPASRVQGDSRLTRDLAQLEAKQQRLARELELLRKALPVAGTQVTEPTPSSTAATQGTKRASEARAPTIIEPNTEQNSAAATADDSVAGTVTAQRLAAGGGAGDGKVDATSGDSKSDAPATVVVGPRPYALQLIGFFDLKSLRELSNRWDLPTQVYYREETYQGRPWYALIHSLHDSYDAAAAELSRLPADLAELDIWIRLMQEGTELKVLETRSEQ